MSLLFLTCFCHVNKIKCHSNLTKSLQASAESRRERGIKFFHITLSQHMHPNELKNETFEVFELLSLSPERQTDQTENRGHRMMMVENRCTQIAYVENLWQAEWENVSVSRCRMLLVCYHRRLNAKIQQKATSAYSFRVVYSLCNYSIAVL